MRKVHWQPYHGVSVTSCGKQSAPAPGFNGLATTNDANRVTCLSCLRRVSDGDKANSLRRFGK
jgi:hypothetical protein